MFNINNKNLISFGLLTIFAFAVILMPKNANANTNTCTLGFTGWYSNYCGQNYNYDSDTDYNNYNNYSSNNINPIPSIVSITPNSASINSNTTITVSGNNFVQSSVVRWNGFDRQTTFINARTLRVQLNYPDLNIKGNYLITVFNPAPGGGYSNAITFTVSNYVAPITKTSTSSTVQKTTNITNNTTTNTTKESIDTSNNRTPAKEVMAGAIFGSNAFLPSSLLQWFFFAILILLAVILWRKLYVSEDEKHTPLKHA